MNREQEIVVGRITRLLEIAANPWCVQCHEKMLRAGFDRYGGQRWMCKECNIRYGYPQAIKDRESRSVFKPEKFKQAAVLFADGQSIRQVMRAVGIAKQTAHRYRRRADIGDLSCHCGQPVTHKGWCRWRYQQSPKRQEFMLKWHGKGR